MALPELKDFIAPVAALIAVGVGIWQYRATSKSNFIRPVREVQLRLYEEASSAAARLATLERDSRAWKEAYQDFLRLFYGPLAIVEDFEHGPNDQEKPDQNDKKVLTVEDAMIVFKACLDDETFFAEFKADLLNLSLALAHACRESVGRSWGFEIEQLKGDYQERALECLDKWNKTHQDKKD
ncbi:MAG TPA: hypothetical protein VGX95_17855 [Xanthobacteraceae bacterium]|jgi:hypothetical protein|nr:hypothetical protein [Xanthobacteraceae bacterium]